MVVEEELQGPCVVGPSVPPYSATVSPVSPPGPPATGRTSPPSVNCWAWRPDCPPRSPTCPARGRPSRRSGSAATVPR
jgi:hypothetical protein